jgi:hypothetical protein
VVFVQHPALGSFALFIDDTAIQTVDCTAPDAVFGVRISISLGTGVHTLRVLPVSGVVAIDAFAVETVSEPPAPPTQEPTDEPVTPEATVEPPAATAVPTDVLPMTPEPPSGPTPDSPASFGHG